MTKTWIISKKINAPSLKAALEMEAKAEIIDIRLVTSEDKQLSSAIGFDVTPSYDDEE